MGFNLYILSKLYRYLAQETKLSGKPATRQVANKAYCWQSQDSPLLLWLHICPHFPDPLGASCLFCYLSAKFETAVDIQRGWPGMDRPK